jgi:hypothetical protein
MSDYVRGGALPYLKPTVVEISIVVNPRVVTNISTHHPVTLTRRHLTEALSGPLRGHPLVQKV